MPSPIASKRTLPLIAMLLGSLCFAAHSVKAEDLVIPLELPQLNFAGLGVGAYPDYFGSRDYDLGVAPFARLSLGGSRFVRLMANEIRLNLLDNRDWQLGPVGLWRFGRDDVDNPVVERIHSIDDYIEAYFGVTPPIRSPPVCRSTCPGAGCATYAVGRWRCST